MSQYLPHCPVRLLFLLLRINHQAGNRSGFSQEAHHDYCYHYAGNTCGIERIPPVERGSDGNEDDWGNQRRQDVGAGDLQKPRIQTTSGFARFNSHDRLAQRQSRAFGDPHQETEKQQSAERCDHS